jgi:hypothetical protein
LQKKRGGTKLTRSRKSRMGRAFFSRIAGISVRVIPWARSRRITQCSTFLDYRREPDCCAQCPPEGTIMYSRAVWASLICCHVKKQPFGTCVLHIEPMRVSRYSKNVSEHLGENQDEDEDCRKWNKKSTSQLPDLCGLRDASQLTKGLVLQSLGR